MWRCPKVDFFGYVPKATISSGISFKTLFASAHKFSLKTQLMEVTLAVPTTEGLIVELDGTLMQYSTSVISTLTCLGRSRRGSCSFWRSR